MPRALAQEIRRAMKRYPQKRSAAMPALWAVQRRYGWCSPEGINQAAAVMGVTPGYLEGVATFYDLFHLEPQGEHQVLVCTNISCWLRGADRLLEAFKEAVEDCQATRPRPARPEAKLRTCRMMSSCRASSAWAPAISRRWPRSTSATTGRSTENDAEDAVEQLRARKEVLPEKRIQDRGAAGPAARVRRQAARAPSCQQGVTASAGEELMPPLKAEETRLLFRNIDEPGLASIKTYRKFGGYQSIRKAYKEMTPEEVLKELEDSGLRGRGGAAFSMGKKASFLPRGDMDKYLCCNADESEPGAFKDRELMQKNPHQLIEGLIIAARAAGANRCFIYIRGEYDLQFDILYQAVEEAYEAGFLGEDVLGTGEQVELVVHRGAGAYICGEETALLDSLEGKRGNPRLKPPFPAVQGLYDGPTLINNVETLSNAPHIIASGADWFHSFGTEQSPGTKVISISGDVKRPGNYEVELGIETRRLIKGLAGGPRRVARSRASSRAAPPRRC